MAYLSVSVRALLLLAAAAGLALGVPQVLAQAPTDLQLELSLVDDADNIVGANQDLLVAAALTYTGEPQRLELAGGSLRVSGGGPEWATSDRPHRLPVNAQTWAQPQQELALPTNLADDARFGAAVAYDPGTEADGSGAITVVSSGNGSVYVYDNAGALIHTLTSTHAADNQEDHGGFGNSIDIDGDLIAVGAPLEAVTIDSKTWNDAGRVYLFQLTRGENPAAAVIAVFSPHMPRTPQADFYKGPSAEGVHFGRSVAVNGDVVAVGTPYSAVSGKNSGGVYLFQKPQDGWANATTADALSLSIPAETGTEGRFAEVGNSVAISGDGSVIVSGGPGIHGRRGAVYLFAKPSGGWATAAAATATLKADPDPVRQIGRSVSVSDDGSVVASSGEHSLSDSGDWAGAAFVWVRPTPEEGQDPAWVDADAQTAWLMPPDGTASRERFGAAVAVHGGGGKIAVYTEAVSNQRRGGVYVFTEPSADPVSGTDAGWGGELSSDDHAFFLPPQSSAADAAFGAALAWAGADVLAGQPGAGAGAAYIMSESAAGDAICTAHEEDGATKYSCPLVLDDPRLILRGSGLVDGNKFTISSSGMTVNGDPVMAELVVEIGRVVEVATVSLELAKGQSSSAEAGSNVAMVLEIHSNQDRPAQPSAIQSILLTAEGGSLSSPAGQAGSCSGVACTINIGSLHSTGDLNRTDAIELTWRTPSVTGSRRVRVTVTPKSGSQKTGLLTIRVTGAAQTLLLTAPSGPLHYRPTADDDDRDVARFLVTARDADNQEVRPPDVNDRFRWDVTVGSAPGARSVKNQFAELTREEQNGEVHLVLQTTGEQLDPGEYVLQVRLNRANGTSRLVVAGSPSSLRISVDGQRLLGGRLTYTVRVRDRRGASVADGTPVTFEAVTTTGRVLAPSGTDSVTSGGRATARYVVVGTGRAVVRVCAGAVCEVELVSVGGVFLPSGGGGGGGGGGAPPAVVTPPPPPPPPDPAEQLSARTPDTFVQWNGARTVRAAALLDALDDIRAVLLWNGNVWLPYARLGGQELPGSINFIAAKGDTLWLIGPAAEPAAAAAQSAAPPAGG